MNIIKLKNVSKFYYSKGVIASGFSKVNLSFDMGEFVAITGESGSGKSTLLNVISGLDSYEEGEMYINGMETSHYTEKDFEDYRRKYVGNIFQNFNLVNSYTVYQNIELVLLLNGNNKKQVKQEVIDLIKKVGLYKFRNTKVSKLSGGQKQRVAIARALAKDTPIIIADEPTGNLDSKSAKSIIKLLNEISKDKLVIIVTHNYDQVENYVTRKIKMHDGRVLEDKKIVDIEPVKDERSAEYKDITPMNKLRLGLRNAFNIVPKFLLIFAVYLFITVAIISEYASFKEQEYIESKNGENYVFGNVSDKRIIIKKKDKASFTEEDYKKINSIENIDYLVKNDILLDTNIMVSDEEQFWLNGNVNNIENFRGELDLGRMPKSSDEVIIEGSINDYYIGYQANELLDHVLYVQNDYTGELDKTMPIKIVGIKYNKSATDYKSVLYVSNDVMNKFSFEINQNYSNINILFRDKYRESTSYNPSFRINTNSNVKVGEAYITSDLNYECERDNCINQSLKIDVENLYYKENLDLKVAKTYTRENIKNLLGITNFDEYNGTVFINPDDYNKLFNKPNYQSSIFVKDAMKIDKTIEELNNLGYNTLAIKDTLVSSGLVQIFRIMKCVVTIILVVVLFFISYFVIRIILKSRNKYFSTIRMLGATRKVSKQLLVIELLAVSNLAYFLFMLLIYLNSINVTHVGFVSTATTYLGIRDYVILYIILMLMSYLISQKFSKKLFKKSAMSTIAEEV